MYAVEKKGQVRYSAAIVRDWLPRVFLSSAIIFFLAVNALAHTPAKPPQPPAQQLPAQNPPAAQSKAATGQTNPPAAPDYSKESSVIEQILSKSRFENDGSSVQTQYAKILIQGAQALQQWGQLIFTYNAASDQPHIDFVRVHKPDGRVVTAGPDAIQDLSSPVARIAPVYTDLRQLHVTVPDLGIGDTLEYELTTKTVHPLVPGEFFTLWNTNKQIITLDDTFEVNVPKDRPLHVKTSNGIAPPKITDEGDRRIYTWHSSFTKRPDDSKDSDKKEKPKNPRDETPDVALSTFSSWEQVGKWYQGLEEPRAAVSPDIRAKADELVKGQTTDMAKVKAIYDYVAKNIRYVSLSFGLGQYQPHLAADVLSNQYGDCKDKATLLQSLLAAEKIKSYPVLINAERKVDPDVPSPGQFDHLINIVEFGGKKYWADTTPGVAPFEFLVAPLRDKLALVIPPDGKASLERTPENPPFMPVDTIDVDAKVDPFGRLTGKMSLAATGDSAVYLRSMLRLVPQSYWQKMSDGLVGMMVGNGATSSDFHFAEQDSIDQPVVYTAQFTQSSFLDLTKKDSSIDLSAAGIQVPAAEQPGKNDTDPLKFGPIRDATVRWKIALPAQISVTLPLPVHVTRDYGEYESTYSMLGSVVTVERHLVLRESELPPGRYNDLMAFRATILADEQQRLTLANASPGVGSIPSGMSADDLYSAGADAEKANNYAGAAKLYAAAAAKDPDHDNVWNALGHADNELGKYSDAIEALQKAIAKNAYDPLAYNNLGVAYQGLGRYDDAIQEYQKQIEVNPLDRFAHSNLGSLYLQQKKYELAQKELKTALQVNPDAVLLYASLGQADLGLHQDADALEAFQKVLEKVPSPITWNNVAWAMADSGTHLDMATQYSENSIRATEAQLNASALSTVGIMQVELTASLPNYWDTMGWIKFKQGDLAAAEGYVHSAWMIADDSTMGDHLGQIYEKEGRKDDAAHTFALALLCPHPPPETRGRLEALVGKKNAQKEIDDARPDLAARRTVKLPNPQNLDGTAEYWVLLGAGPKVADAKFISGDAKVNGFADALRAAKFPYTFPPGDTTQIVLRGVLFCGTASHECTFTPFPIDQALRETIASSSPSDDQ